MDQSGIEFSNFYASIVSLPKSPPCEGGVFTVLLLAHKKSRVSSNLKLSQATTHQLFYERMGCQVKVTEEGKEFS